MRKPRSERRKKFGQCFMEDPNLLRFEARLASVEGKRVLEIGAGDGRLTEALLQNSPKKIFAAEIDGKFASVLREKFAGKAVEVIEANFLKIEPPEFDVVVGNIPYYISSDIIFKLKDMKFERGVLMVQNEFARKMIAKPSDSNYGRLSVTSQLFFDVRFERKVFRHLFRPIPKVDSAIIVIKPTGISLTPFQENIIRYLFQHKNKKVRNALLDSKMFDKAELEVLGAFAKRRVNTLSKEDCLEIASILSKSRV